MLEHHVSAAITRKRLYEGPAANHVDDFSDWLHARGYKKRTVFRMLQSFAAWTDWLTKTGRTTGDFAEGLRECLNHLAAVPYAPYQRGPRLESLSVVRHFLRFLKNAAYFRRLRPMILICPPRRCSESSIHGCSSIEVSRG